MASPLIRQERSRSVATAATTREKRFVVTAAEAVRAAIAETAHLSARAAADALNRRGIRTAGGKQWHATQIIRLRDRLGL